MVNKAFCDSCGKLVAATSVERDGRIFLEKCCPDCGDKQTYISSDAERYHAKRAVDIEYEYGGCSTACRNCTHDRHPRFTFVNVTNRCNAACPICFDNVPGLGFEFEPPMDYFRKLFGQLAEYRPKPTVCLFGGEPTVREDIFDIIMLARKRGLKPWIFTNGQRLANPEYCQKIAETPVRIMFSYDGADPRTYGVLRGTEKALDLKSKAIENLRRFRRPNASKITMVSVFSKGLNDQGMRELLDYVHERRDVFDTIYLMPLCHTWDTANWDFDPERITTEDVEILVDQAFPEHKVEFLPLGFINQFQNVMQYLGRAPRAYGAHPNCESVYGLVSDGEKWVPINHFIRGSMYQLAKNLLSREKKIATREKRWQTGPFGRLLGALRLREFALRLVGLPPVVFLLMRYLRVGRVIKGRGPAKLGHGFMLLFGRLFGIEGRKLLAKHSNVQAALKLVVLPLEDKHVLETDRLERCPTYQAYLEPVTEQLNLVPLCAWKLHNKEVLREIADHYRAERERSVASEAAEATEPAEATEA